MIALIWGFTLGVKPNLLELAALHFGSVCFQKLVI